MKNENIRWGIIGVGDVTEVKSGPAYQKTEGFELTAVMRRNFEKVKDYASRHKIKHYFTDADELINHPEVDAIYIATPPDVHKLYALKVAAAGKPCCIEKPMAPTYDECVEIEQAFHAQNLPLFVAYYRRTLPKFVQVKTWLDEGKIGEIRHVHCKLYKQPSELDLSRSYNWRTDAIIAPGGYFDDLASHELDLLSYYFGTVVSVHGECSNQQGLYSAFDSVSASWKYENGVTGSGVWNFGSFQNIDEIEIVGSKGGIRFSSFDEAPIELIKSEGTQELTLPFPKNVQFPHVQLMQKALTEDGFMHPSTGENGVHTAWVMDKILGKI